MPQAQKIAVEETYQHRMNMGQKLVCPQDVRGTVGIPIEAEIKVMCIIENVVLAPVPRVGGRNTPAIRRCEAFAQ